VFSSNCDRQQYVTNRGVYQLFWPPRMWVGGWWWSTAVDLRCPMGRRGLCSADHVEAVNPFPDYRRSTARQGHNNIQCCTVPPLSSYHSHTLIRDEIRSPGITQYFSLHQIISLFPRIAHWAKKNVVWPERWCTSNTPAEMEQFFFEKKTCRRTPATLFAYVNWS